MKAKRYVRLARDFEVKTPRHTYVWQAGLLARIDDVQKEGLSVLLENGAATTIPFDYFRPAGLPDVKQALGIINNYSEHNARPIFRFPFHVRVRLEDLPQEVNRFCEYDRGRYVQEILQDELESFASKEDNDSSIQADHDWAGSWWSDDDHIYFEHENKRMCFTDLKDLSDHWNSEITRLIDVAKYQPESFDPGALDDAKEQKRETEDEIIFLAMELTMISQRAAGAAKGAEEWIKNPEAWENILMGNPEEDEDDEPIAEEDDSYIDAL